MNTKPKVLIVLGPTGVGKSELTYQVVPELVPHGHIINADSQQVYLGLDLGTAKPSKGEQSLLPHHLFDICQPDQQFSAGDFKQCLESLVPSISDSGGLPIVLGGTGFYIKHAFYHYSNPPPSDPEVRGQLEKDCLSYGLTVMRERLKTWDPQSYLEISPQDKYRILRALEIFLISGKPRSHFLQSLQPRGDWDWTMICLNRSRQELYERINQRVDAMIAKGLVDEIRGLIAQGWTFENPGLQAIGYKEFAPVFPSSIRLGSKDDALDQIQVQQAREEIKQHSRNYAKRQLTYFRGFKEAVWLTNPTKESYAQLLKLSLTET